MIGLAEDCLTKSDILNYFGQKQCDPNSGDLTCADYNTQVYQLYLQSGLQNKACVLTSDLPDLNAPRSYSPVLQMIPGGGKIVSGDSWMVQLSGAPPNSPVTIKGGPNGNLVSQLAGNTDLLGRKQLSGKFIDSQIGDWEQIWYISGQEVGRIAFTVIPNPTIAFTSGRIDPGAGSTSIFGTAIGSPDAPLTAISRTTGAPVSTSVAQAILLNPPVSATSPGNEDAPLTNMPMLGGSAQAPASNIGLALLAAGIIGFLILGGGR